LGGIEVLQTTSFVPDGTGTKVIEGETMKRSIFLGVAGILILLNTLKAQQTVKASAVKSSTEEANIDSYISLLRQDVKKGKVAVLTEMMELTPDEASKFWPVYNDYDKELSKLGDERVALLRDYGQNYGTMTEQKIVEIGRKALDLETRRTEMKKRYFDRLSKSVSARVAGRFLQIENQLLMLLDLQMASSLPIVE
jgi:hypothetical protein